MSPVSAATSPMDSLDGVVKVEVQAQEPLNIPGIFSKCGEMYASRFFFAVEVVIHSCSPSQVSASFPAKASQTVLIILSSSETSKVCNALSTRQLTQRLQPSMSTR